MLPYLCERSRNVFVLTSPFLFLYLKYANANCNVTLYSSTSYKQPDAHIVYILSSGWMPRTAIVSAKTILAVESKSRRDLAVCFSSPCTLNCAATDPACRASFIANTVK